jgi:CMP-N,N'-diacetyllegionaminic acid synthase
MKTKKAIAIIHARGGSKRIPLKNLCLLGGKPLLSYPIALCQRCEWVERIIVSTDHDEIMSVAREYGAEIPFRRPADISEDVPSEMVTYHALQFLRDRGDNLPEFVVTLTPATPLTSVADLDEAFRLISFNPEWDSVTAVRRSKEHPEWMLVVNKESGEVQTLMGNSIDGEYNVSQNLKKYYYPTGAFWINRTETFMKTPVLYGKKWGAMVMAVDQTVDIDWPEDLRAAEALIGTSER